MENELVKQTEQEAAAVVQWANNLVVNTVDDYKAVVVRLQDIKAIRKRWTDIWQPLKEKAHISWKALVAEEKKGTDVCDLAEEIAKRKALNWKMEADRKAADEQRRLQAQADEAARRERERLEKAAEKLKTPELKEARMEEAAAVIAPVVTISPPTADIAGAGSRKTWKAEIIDLSALIAAATPGSDTYIASLGAVAASFLEFNQKAADAFARSTKGKVAVAGLKFIEVESLSIGRE